MKTIFIIIIISIGIKILTNLIYCNALFLDTVLASKLMPSSSSSQSSVQHFLLNLFSIFQYCYNILSSSSLEDGSDVLQVTVGLIDLFTVFASLNGSFSSSLLSSSLSSSSSSFSSSSPFSSSSSYHC